MATDAKLMEGITKSQNDYVWQDREIRFDSRPNTLACRKGEQIIDSINSVEDTKGNNGERGSLIITNLRIVWISHENTRINLSVGLGAVVSANIKQAKSKLRGTTQALCVLAKYNTRFEFIFTSLVKNSPRMFTTIQSVLRAYETSKLYRDLKLRGSILKDNDLNLLPQEQVFSKVTGVWNLSSEQGNLGSFFLTNVRVVWHANLAANFNVSLPYIQIKCMRMRDSKFGRAIVLETFSKAGGYILGFRVDPKERINDVFREMLSLYQVYSTTPVFGVDFAVESADNPSNSSSTNHLELLNSAGTSRVTEDVELIDEQEDSQAIAAYYSQNGALDGDGLHDLAVDNIQFDPKLGLAVETLVSGLTLEQLWRVMKEVPQQLTNAQRKFIITDAHFESGFLRIWMGSSVNKSSLVPFTVCPCFSDIEIMQEFDELFTSTKSAIDGLRSGLQSITDEEQELLLLRHQLSKIKKIREEQQKKDALIVALNERVAILEHAAANSSRQSSEVQEIMNERILTLERYAAEKDVMEREYLDKIFMLEEKCRSVESLEAELSLERKRSGQMQQLYEKVSEELANMHVSVKSDRQLNEHMQTLFDSLRDELRAKEAELDALRRKEALTDSTFYTDCINTRKALDKTQHDLMMCDEANKRADKALALSKLDHDQLVEDKRRLAAEVDALKKRVAESESKTVSAQSKYNKLKAERAANAQDVTCYRNALQSLSDSMKYMSNMLERKEDVQEEQIVSELRGMLRSMTKSIHEVEAADNRNSPAIATDLHRMVKYITQLVNILLDYRQVSIEINGQLTQKTSSCESISNAFQEVEDKFSVVLHDSVMADNVASALVEAMEKAGVLAADISEERVPNVLDSVSFKLKKRERIYSHLIRGSQRLLSTFPCKQRFADLQAEHIALKEKHAADVQHFQNLQDEACLAVHVSNSEVERSNEILHGDFRRKLEENSARYEQQIDDLNAVMVLLVERYKQALLCLQCMLFSVNRAEDRLQSLKQVNRVHSHIGKGYAILAKDIKTIAMLCEGNAAVGGVISAKRSRVSLKMVALAVLAMNRWRALAKERRRDQTINAQLMDNLSRKFSIENHNPQDIMLFAKLWALPEVDAVQSRSPEHKADLVVQYLRGLLALKSSDHSEHDNVSAKHSILEFISQSTRINVGNIRARKELFGQKELNSVHSRLLELVEQKSIWQEKHEKLKCSVVVIEQRLAACEEHCSSLQNDNNHLKLKLEVAEGKTALAEAAAAKANEAAREAHANHVHVPPAPVPAAVPPAPPAPLAPPPSRHSDAAFERPTDNRARRYEDTRDSSASEQDESLLALSKSLYREGRGERSPHDFTKSRHIVQRTEHVSQTRSEMENDRRAAISKLEARRRNFNEDIEATARTLAQTKLLHSPPQSRSRASSSHSLATRYMAAMDDSIQADDSSVGDWSFRKNIVRSEQTVFDSNSLIYSRNSTPQRSRDLHHSMTSATQTPSREDSSMAQDTSFNSSFQANTTHTSHVSSGETTTSRFLRINSAEKAKNEMRDMELLEIYSDIGRLTGRLETRLRHSSSSPVSSPDNSMRK